MFFSLPVSLTTFLSLSSRLLISSASYSLLFISLVLFLFRLLNFSSLISSFSCFLPLCWGCYWDSSLKSIEYPYDHYFKYSIKHITSLALLLWFCSVLSFERYSSVSSLYLIFCVCFYVLGTRFPALKSSDLIKKRFYNCPAVQCPLFTRTWHFRGFSYYCGWATLAFSPVICNGRLCLLWARFGPCAVSGPVWGHLGLEFCQTRHLPEIQ